MKYKSKRESKREFQKEFKKELMEHLKLKKYYKNIPPEEVRAIMRAYFEKNEYEKRKKLH